MRHELGGPMAAVPDALPRAMPLQPLEPFDGYGFADAEAPSRRAAAHPSSHHRVDHPVPKILRIGFRHAGWPPPPSQHVEIKSKPIRESPLRFKPRAARSRLSARTITAPSEQRSRLVLDGETAERTPGADKPIPWFCPRSGHPERGCRCAGRHPSHAAATRRWSHKTWPSGPHAISAPQLHAVRADRSPRRRVGQRSSASNSVALKSSGS